MHPKWLQNKTRKTFQHKDLCRWGQNTKHKKMPCERLEEKLLWTCREKELSPFLRLSQCSCKAALWLPALWISTPASLFITSTQSPYLPSTALDYREGTLSREAVKANEHRVNPELQQRDTSARAARGFQHGQMHTSVFFHCPWLAPGLPWSYGLTAWSPMNTWATLKAFGARRNAVLAVHPAGWGSASTDGRGVLCKILWP